MTITVTIEDLRDFETRMIRWGTDRAFYFAEHVRDYPYCENRRRMEVLAEWEKSNPIPKLIPSV